MRRITGAILFLFGVVAATGACSSDSGDGCSSDQDCPGEELCAEGRCSGGPSGTGGTSSGSGGSPGSGGGMSGPRCPFTEAACARVGSKDATFDSSGALTSVDGNSCSFLRNETATGCSDYYQCGSCELVVIDLNGIDLSSLANKPCSFFSSRNEIEPAECAGSGGSGGTSGSGGSGGGVGGNTACDNCIAGCQGLPNCCTGSGCACESACMVTGCAPGRVRCCGPGGCLCKDCACHCTFCGGPQAGC